MDAEGRYYLVHDACWAVVLESSALADSRKYICGLVCAPTVFLLAETVVLYVQYGSDGHLEGF